MGYRFTIGTKVLCRTGAEEWSPGKIVKLTYREDHWPPGKVVPYQVQLEDGRLIFVPVDTDQLCRKIVPPWWDVALSKPGSHYATTNPPADALAKDSTGKNINQADHRGFTALMEATTKRWPNGISKLISLKADVDVEAADKTCAIHIAATHGPDIIKLLVDAKANVNCQDKDPDFDPDYTSKTFGDRLEHRTPLHYVCLEGDVEAAKVLLAAKANANIQDAQMKTPLHLAIDAERTDTIDLLLASGIDVNLGNIESGIDNSPLMDAAFNGHCDLLKKLLAAKSDVNKQGKQEMSALHLAARKCHVEIAEALISAKADMNQQSKVGSALQLAQKNGGADLQKVFGVNSPESTGYVGSVSTLDAAQRAALFLD